MLATATEKETADKMKSKMMLFFEAMESLDDFYVELHWDFHTWVCARVDVW
jgi:hypothetical protein